MHSGNLIILYTMYRCIPSYGAHCPSRNTPQRDLRKRGDWIWGDLVAHSEQPPGLIIESLEYAGGGSARNVSEHTVQF